MHASVTAAMHIFTRPGLTRIPIPELTPLSAALAWRSGTSNPNISALAETIHENRQIPAENIRQVFYHNGIGTPSHAVDSPAR